MSSFRTEFHLPESQTKLSHKNTFFCMGSCFADTMANKLSETKFNTHQNPFGTLFHPLAMENALMRIYANMPYEAHEIFNYGETFFSWDHHTSFDGLNTEATLTKINTQLDLSNKYFKDSNTFIFTLGTAWVYQLKANNMLVANCHKVPNSQFDKILLSEAQIVSSLMNCIEMINDTHAGAQIIFSLSPVRHLKDGFVENNLSKARLLSAIHYIADQYPNVQYFPAYELILDDLRDYRFYAEDMLHPNKTAIDYVWNKFSTMYFTPSTQNLNERILKINNALKHKAFNADSMAHKQFIFNLTKQVEELSLELPKNAFAQELETLKNA